MKNLLNRIEKVEANNPLLTAALKEVERLNNKLYEIKEIIEAKEVKERIDEGPYKILKGHEELRAKMEWIERIITPEG